MNIFIIHLTRMDNLRCQPNKDITFIQSFIDRLLYNTKYPKSNRDVKLLEMLACVDQ